MSTLASLKTFNWYKFLGQWSQEFLATSKNLGHLPAEIIESDWLGYPGATEEQITQAEERLNVSLPPSYREFLKVSNGWRQTTPFIYRIWSIEEIEWFIKRHHSWINSFIQTQMRSRHDYHQNGHQLNGHVPRIPDSEYFLYGEEQDCSKIRPEYLSTALEISDKGESAIYLLNPKIQTGDGEWEAWFFGNWLPGADRYPSFQEMMQAEYKNFLEMREI